jgi:hypothetical protein
MQARLGTQAGTRRHRVCLLLLQAVLSCCRCVCVNALHTCSKTVMDTLFRQGKGGRLKLESKKPVILVLGTGWGAHSLVKVGRVERVLFGSAAAAEADAAASEAAATAGAAVCVGVMQPAALCCCAPRTPPAGHRHGRV